MKRGALWPIGIATVLVGTMGFNIWVMRIAGSDPSVVVEADYYRKAVDYDRVMAEQRASAALGWTLAPTLAPVGPARQATITVALRDRAGLPLDGARVRVEGFAVARSATVVGVTLAEQPDGTYAGTLPVATTGRWELRVHAEKGADRFAETVHVDAVAARATASR